MANSNDDINVSTQIRNLYSDGISYLNVSFYNLNLSFKFYPFKERNINNGRSRYDLNNGKNTTVNFEGAYVLYDLADKITKGIAPEVNGVEQSIPCAKGAELMFERKLNPSTNQMETTFTIKKEGVIIPFKFSTTTRKVMVNGKIETKVVEAGLGAFMKIIDGYLVGINSDRHLDKYTEEYAKKKEAENNRNGGYKKSSNKPYYNQKNNSNNGWAQQTQQNMSSYNIQN